MAQWPFLPIGSYSPTTGRSGEPMNSTRLSIFFLLGLIAVARADPSTEANIAIDADLARAQAALAQHNLSAVLDALDDTKKYWSNADEKTLQELSAFQDRVRETLTATTTQPTVLSSPAVPPSAPSPPNHAAATDQAPSLSFTERAASAPTQPAARQHKSEPKVTLRSARPRAARADPSAEASIAIKADLAKAQQALAQHNLSAVVDALDDTKKYWSNADEKTLQELSAFQDRVRETLTATTTQPTVLSSPAVPPSAPSPPNHAAAPDQAPSLSFTERAASAPTQPAAPQHKSEPKVTLRSARPRAARADPSAEASIAIKADLAKAQQALAQHNLSAVVDTLNDTVKYLSNADEKTLHELIAFQDRVRETLRVTTTRPTLLSSPASPAYAPSPPNQAAGPDQARSGSFTGQEVAPTQPAARQDKFEPDVTLRLTQPRAHAVTAPEAGPVAGVQFAPSSPVPSEVTAPPAPHAAGQSVATAMVPRVATALTGRASPTQLAPRPASRKPGPGAGLARQSDVEPVENPSHPAAVQMPAPKAPSAASTAPAVAQLVSASRALQDNDAEGARGLLEAAETSVVFAPAAGTSRGDSIAAARITEALRMLDTGDRTRAVQCVEQALAAFESPTSVGATLAPIVPPAGAAAGSTGVEVARGSGTASQREADTSLLPPPQASGRNSDVAAPRLPAAPALPTDSLKGARQSADPSLTIHFPKDSAFGLTDAHELATLLGSRFSQITLVGDNRTPPSAIVEYYSTRDHPTTKNIGSELGRMGYHWRIEYVTIQRPDSVPDIVDVWIPPK
jgi:uncharacterized protein YaaR (DUF327 family)